MRGGGARHRPAPPGQVPSATLPTEYRAAEAGSSVQSSRRTGRWPRRQRPGRDSASDLDRGESIGLHDRAAVPVNLRRCRAPDRQLKRRRLTSAITIALCCRPRAGARGRRRDQAEIVAALAERRPSRRCTAARAALSPPSVHRTTATSRSLQRPRRRSGRPRAGPSSHWDASKPSRCAGRTTRPAAGHGRSTALPRRASLTQRPRSQQAPGPPRHTHRRDRRTRIREDSQAASAAYNCRTCGSRRSRTRSGSGWPPVHHVDLQVPGWPSCSPAGGQVTDPRKPAAPGQQTRDRNRQHGP